MKTYLLKPMVVVCLCLLTASFTFAADNYKMVKVKAPFPMQPIKVFIYPDKDFLITDYGAKNGGEDVYKRQSYLLCDNKGFPHFLKDKDVFQP